MHEQHLVHVIGHGGGIGGGGGGVGGPGIVDHNVTFAPAPIVPVDDGSSCAGGLSGGLGNLKLIVEAPPVTELVTETPLENGLSSSALGVIGGK